MKILLFTSLIFLFSLNSLAQENLKERFNGTYYLLEAERGANNKPTKEKIVQFGENNGTKLLAIAACEKCIPAVYTYQEKDSKTYKKPIFFNSFGLYVLPFDEESFVIVQVTSKLGSGKWNKFTFLNFYSRNKSKVAEMTKQKVEDFARAFSTK